MASNYYDKNKPKYEWGFGWTKKSVTEKQAQYLEQLAGQTNVALKNTTEMTRGQASGLIDELKRYAGGDRHSPRYLERDYNNFVEVNKNEATA